MKRGSLAADAWRRLLRNKMAVAGGVFVIFLVIIAIFAPYIAPYPFDEADFRNAYQPPCRGHPLGTDSLGRDLLSRLIWGARISLAVGFIGAITSFVIGVLWGTIAGFCGGLIDNLMMRVVDFLYAFPTMLFVILLMVVFKVNVATTHNPVILAMSALDDKLGGMLFVMIGIGAVSWVGIARLSRGLALSIAEEEYVEAARAIGNSSLRIVTKHILPNLMGPCVVYVSLGIPGYISTEAFLSFIGLGVTPPTPSWGAMISEGYQVMLVYPHMALFPAIALGLTMLAFNFLGDGLRDALDVQM